MVTPRREAKETVAFVDHYCWLYRSLFEDVRHFEAFKYLHLGMLSEIKRKSLPKIARVVGLKDGQSLHHFLREVSWSTEAVKETRLWLTKLLIGEREVTLIIDETGDEKKGKSTDYVARQYIGNLGKIENGIVSVNAYGLVDKITYPLLFKIYKPHSRLKPGDIYRTKTELAVEIIEELRSWGLRIKLVLADSLYGESSNVITAISKEKWNYIVAIRSNHGVWLRAGQRVRRNKWIRYEQTLKNKKVESRHIREIIFGQRRLVRYFEISKGEVPDPSGKESWYVMTNLTIKKLPQIAMMYTWRNWIEYAFKQVKNQLGWADFRVTDYQSIDKWWELVMSSYLLVSLQAHYFDLETVIIPQQPETNFPESPAIKETILATCQRHPWWQKEVTWQGSLNNLRLIMQPYTLKNLLQPWLLIINIPRLKRGLEELANYLNRFLGLSTLCYHSYSPFQFATG